MSGKLTLEEIAKFDRAGFTLYLPNRKVWKLTNTITGRSALTEFEPFVSCVNHPEVKVERIA